jgi:hypothetical protein
LDSYVSVADDSRAGDRGKRLREPSVGAGGLTDSIDTTPAPAPAPRPPRLPAQPAGTAVVCHSWVRQKGPCKGQDECKGATKRAHSFDGWDKVSADTYRAAVVARTLPSL